MCDNLENQVEQFLPAASSLLLDLAFVSCPPNSVVSDKPVMIYYKNPTWSYLSLTCETIDLNKDVYMSCACVVLLKLSSRDSSVPVLAFFLVELIARWQQVVRNAGRHNAP